MNLVRQLQQISAFDHFDAQALELFASSLEPRQYAAGEVIVHADTGSREVFVLLGGSVEVVDAKGAGPWVIGHKRVGQLFGLVGLLTGTKRTTQLRAASQVDVAVLSTYAFDLLYRHSGPCCIALGELVARQLILDFRAVQATYFEAQVQGAPDGEPNASSQRDVDEALDRALRSLSAAN